MSSPLVLVIKSHAQSIQRRWKMSLPFCYKTELIAVPSRVCLQGWWRELESRANPSFFNSWTWIGTWLEVLPGELEVALLRTQQSQVTVGLGLVVRGRTHLLKGIPVDCWRLHATGLTDVDDLTIEYNGLLLDQHHADDVAPEMIRFLLDQTDAPHLEIPLADHSYQNHVARLGPAYMARRQHHLSRHVDLNEVRQANGGFLSLLSANKRSQIRRSQKEYLRLGELAIHEAESLTEARSYLAALKILHQHTWEERGIKSGFGSLTIAHDFHDKLLAEGFPRGEIQLLRISAGPRVLGYLYNFRLDGRISFYQSGFQYQLLDKHDRPGLLSHVMAIEHNAVGGAHCYDFLAGEHLYKHSLATHSAPQASYVIQRNSMLPRLDASLRHLHGHTRQQIHQHKRSIKLVSLSMAFGVLPALEDVLLAL